MFLSSGKYRLPKSTIFRKVPEINFHRFSAQQSNNSSQPLLSVQTLHCLRHHHTHSLAALGSKHSYYYRFTEIKEIIEAPSGSVLAQSGEVGRCAPDSCFSLFNVHVNHLGISLKCRIRFRAGTGPDILLSNRFLSHPNAALLGPYV